MNKVNPYIIAVEIHAGPAHVKRIVSSLNLTEMWRVHDLVFMILIGQNIRNHSHHLFFVF
jgi:hypothetical protein